MLRRRFLTVAAPGLLATLGCTIGAPAQVPSGIPLTSVFSSDELQQLQIEWRPIGPRYFVIRDADELRAFNAEVQAHRPPPPIGLTALIRSVSVSATGGLADIIVDAGPNLIAPAGEPVPLEGASRGGLAPIAYDWSGVDLTTGASVPPAERTSLEPAVSPVNDTLYSLTATDQTGRSRRDSTTVYTVDFSSEMLIAYSFCQSSVVLDQVTFEGDAIAVRVLSDPSFIGIPCFPVPSFQTRVFRLPLGFPVQFYDRGGDLVTDASDPILSANIVPDGSAGSIQAVYLSGGRVELTATPADGFAFQRWEGPVTGSRNPVVTQVTQDQTVTAVFAADGSSKRAGTGKEG